MQFKKLFHLDDNGRKSDCVHRTDSKSRFDQKSTWRFLGLASSHFRNEKKFAGTSDWSGQISPALIQCLRWLKAGWAACTPCIWNEIGGSEKKINHEGDRMQHMQTAAEHRGFTSFQMVHTHTHQSLVHWTGLFALFEFQQSAASECQLLQQKQFWILLCAWFLGQHLLMALKYGLRHTLRLCQRSKRPHLDPVQVQEITLRELTCIGMYLTRVDCIDVLTELDTRTGSLQFWSRKQKASTGSLKA